jgi:hypothetical protein
MSYIVEAWGEMFWPSAEQIARREEAERRRFVALPWRKKAAEIVKEYAFGLAWMIAVVLVLSLTFGPWVYGVYALWTRFL